jgi:hypothetical protein
MEPVLLGLAAPSAANAASNLLERTVNTLSKPFAAVLHAMTDSADTADQTAPALEVANLETQFAKLQTNLAQQINKALASAGVELTEPLELRVSEIDGSLEVVGNHPQRALIESALADDEQLSQNFTTAIALQQLLAAFEAAEEVDSSTDSVDLSRAEDNEVTGLFSNEGAEVTLTFH